MTTATKMGASALWILLLTMASTATTLALSCATPFAALAALAAAHMRQRDGLILLALAWLASQLSGFFILHYAIEDTTYGWSLGLLVAAIASGLGARAALGRMEGQPMAIRLAAAYVAAFAAFKLVIIAFSAFWLGGVDTALDIGIAGRQFLRNAAILVGLLALYRVLVSAGVPAARHELAAA